MKHTSSYNYRQTIASELSARRQRNASYSMRAFAKSLGVSASMISQILSGKREISRKAALSMAEALALTPLQKKKFLASAVGDAASLDEALAKNPNYTEMEIDRFQMIAGWQHFAILSLIEIKGSRWDKRWIAEKLCISEEEAELAMQRLERLRFVEVTGESFKQSENPVIVQSPVPSASIRAYHRQNLKKAIASLAVDPVQERDFSSITMAIDSHKLETARGIIRKFREDMFVLLKSKSNSDRVYTLAVQLFPVSTK